MLQKLYEEHRENGFEVIAVNHNDKAADIAAFLKERGITFPVGLNGQGVERVTPKFNVDAFPSNFIIGPSGKILWREVGYNEAKLRLAIEQAMRGEL